MWELRGGKPHAAVDVAASCQLPLNMCMSGMLVLALNMCMSALQCLAMDVSAHVTMKGTAKRDSLCELQNSVNQ